MSKASITWTTELARGMGPLYHHLHGLSRPVLLNATKDEAQLIAAAPELLAALKACDEAMSYMSEYDIPITLPDQVKAAIAKAEGAA